MRCLILSVAAIASIAAAAPAHAYTIKGAVECPVILEEHKNEDYRAMNRWWLLGYITARNYNDNADVSRGIGEHDIYQVAYDYCARNSSSDWDDAAQHVYNHYRK